VAVSEEVGWIPIVFDLQQTGVTVAPVPGKKEKQEFLFV